MNSSKHVRQAAIFAAFFLFLMSTKLALCQSGPPPIPIIWLDYYSFPQTNLDSDYGYPPIGESNAFIIPFWDATALWLDTSNEVPAFVHYRVVETNGFVNIDLAAGTIFIQVVPDWASADTNQFGQGPGSRGYILASGDFSTGSPDGLWAIYVDAGGTNIYFGGVSNLVTNTYVSAPISWGTNSLHEIGVYYRTNTELFLDGQWVATGGPVTVVPATNTWTNGFFVGSDDLGFEQFRGIIPYVELDTTNMYLFATNYLTLWWDSDTNSYYTWLDGDGGGGGFHPDGGGVFCQFSPDTSRDLPRMVTAREFRADLYYRLNVFPLRAPALRERSEDIPLLVRHFVEIYSGRASRRITEVPVEAMEVLVSYQWPGNVRELQNVVERAVILSPGKVLRPCLEELQPLSLTS
jgi:hypothetical protein